MRILIVDDNTDITDLFSKFFTLNNHECVIINESSKAVEYILQEKFDKIILDLVMPEFSGLDILKNINEKKNIEFLDIIVLTSADISKKEERELIRMGVKRVLKKPILLNKINEMILN